MFIQKVRIRNIRGFSNLDLDFCRPSATPAGWTVLAGRNGSGKSTLLRAIALSIVGPSAARVLQESFSEWIQTGKEGAEVETLVELSPGDKFEGAGRLPEDPFWTGLRWRRNPDQPEPTLSSYLSSNPQNRRKAPIRGPWAENPGGWLVVGYGPYRRISGHATAAQRLMVGPDRIARLVSLFREDASLVECVEWLREIYLWALEKKPGAQELLDSVISLLNDGLLPDHVLVEGIDSNGLWVLQHGARLPLDQLSDGYRTTAALVMDIVRHLYRCFGRLRIVEATDDDGTFLQVPHGGVFLIDEVDLHLHVSWQKQIGFWLKRHFPKIQFIVTTHSPFICQAADTRGLIRLPAPGEIRQAKHVSETLYNTIVNGGADDAVLTELFGLESPYSAESERLRELVAKLEALLQSGRATERERKRLKVLRARLPQTLTSDVAQALRKLAFE